MCADARLTLSCAAAFATPLTRATSTWIIGGSAFVYRIWWYASPLYAVVCLCVDDKLHICNNVQHTISAGTAHYSKYRTPAGSNHMHITANSEPCGRTAASNHIHSPAYLLSTPRGGSSTCRPPRQSHQVYRRNVAARTQTSRSEAECCPHNGRHWHELRYCLRCFYYRVEPVHDRV
jgi:hypothetical protein